MYDKTYKPLTDSPIQLQTLKVVQETIKRQVPLYGILESNIKTESYIDHVADEMILTLTRKRAMKELPSYTVMYPATWWDHFKDSWFSAKLKERFPVVMQRVVVGADVFYDHIPIKDYDHEVRIYVKGDFPHE